MRFDQLLYLREIANTGSFIRAAQRLNISQPSLSQAIAALELELGVQLFNRSRQGTQLTEAGKIVFAKAYEVNNILDEIKSLSSKQQSLLSGKIKIGAIPSFCITILPKTIVAFKHKYPNINIEIVEEGSLEIVNHLNNGEIDIGLVSRRKVTTFDKSMYFTPLFEGRVMACVNNKSPLASKKNVSLEEIISWPLVLFNQNYRMHNHLLSLLSKFGKPNIFLTARNSLTIKRIVVEGLAIGFDASISLNVDPYVENGSIIPLNIMEETDTSFGVLFKKKYITLATEEFIDELSLHSANFCRVYNIKSYV